MNDLYTLIIISLFVSILFVAFSIDIFRKKTLKISFYFLDIPIVLICLSLVVSAILKTPNKMEAFFVPGMATAAVLGLLVYFFVKRLVVYGRSHGFTYFLFYLSIANCLFSIFTFLSGNPLSIFGSKISELTYIASTLPIGIYLAVTTRNVYLKFLNFASLAIVSICIVVNVNLILPGKPNSPVFPSWGTSWSIAADTIKYSPFFGIGTGNYLSAFSQFLPITYNLQPQWPVRFSSARSYLLNIMTENGMLGVVSFILLLVLSVKNLFGFKFTNTKYVYGFSLFILLTSLVFFPGNIILTVYIFILSALSHDGKHKDTGFKMPILGILPISVIFLMVYIAYKPLLAEYYFRKSITHITKNEAKEAYETLRKSIEQNSQVDRYHATFAQVNLALAQGFSKQQDLKEQDKNTISQLAQQAIAEGKATVALNPQRANNWELLAKVYTTIIPLAKDSDQFAIDSYKQAIALDPINPNLRISLGSVYYSLKKYPEAIAIFEDVNILKPDLANGHFNLAVSYRENGEIEKAIAEMKKVLELVKPNSREYTTAQEELTKLESIKK